MERTMKRTLLFSILALITTAAPGLAQAQVRHLTPEQACAVDKLCVKTFYRDTMRVRAPKAEQIAYYNGTFRLRLASGEVVARPMRDAIIAIANKYGIDPVTLVLAPIAENTMNVQVDDKLADEMDDRGLMDEQGQILGKAFSLGPGQIYVFRARSVEDLAARIEGRPVRKDGEIKKQLHSPIGALKYAAALIRDAQDAYARVGKDISRRPEILTTLYNIGKIEKRISKNRDQEPLPNYFGYWCGENYDIVRRELNLPSTIYP